MPKAEKFRVRMSEVPDHLTVEQWIRRKSTIEKHFAMTPERDVPKIMKFTIDAFDHTAVTTAVEEAFRIYGWWGFLSHFDDTNRRTADYGGISITHNPQINNGAPEHASALGEPRFNLHDILLSQRGLDIWIELERRDLVNKFYAVVYEHGLVGLKKWLEEIGYNTDWYADWDKPYQPVTKVPRNSYPDSYAFRQRSKASHHGALGVLLDRFNRSMIRSRIATINASHWNSVISKRMWHHDEPIFINTRINIPLTTAAEFVYEVEGVGLGRFDLGYVYSWDTSKMHRVYALHPSPNKRTHLVIGSAPWFNYIPDEDMWEANEFFGEKHPFDMLIDGDFINGIKLETQQ